MKNFTYRLLFMTAFLSMIIHMPASGQKITLVASNAPLEDVLSDIGRQSGYIFWYEPSMLQKSKRITLSLKDVPLKQALEQCFAGQPLGYEMVDHTIVITGTSASARAPNRITISGKVTDLQSQPLPGVSVRVKGTETGTVTDREGNYSIASDPQGIIIFSFVGFHTIEIRINGRSRIDMTMQENTKQLQETVVKGYYTTSKAQNTGNVSTVKAAEISKQPVSDPLMALEGRVAGLYITQESGVPGSSLAVRLRGRNSIANGNDPFYIIDGVPFTSASLSQNFGSASAVSPFNSIRPDDIENIEVLKDADATAIYGSRGANGVVLITTKKGKTGKTKTDFNIYTGAGKVTRKMQLMNTEQYLAMRKEAFVNDSTMPAPWDFDVNGTWDTTRYTDWQDVLIGGTANVTDITGSISGGTAQTRFIFNAGYRHESTVYPGDYTTRKGSGRLSVQHQSLDNRFRAGFTAGYVRSYLRLPVRDLTFDIFYAPNAPSVYNADGSLNWEGSTWMNPFGPLEERSVSLTDNLIGNAELSYEIIKGLQIKSSFGYNMLRVEDSNVLPFSAVDPATPDPPLARQLSFGDNTLRSWIIEPQIDYNIAFSDHHIELLAGATFQQNKQRGLQQLAKGFSSDVQINDPVAAASVVVLQQIYSDYRYNAAFARLGYDFRKKYILNLTGRRDGSSRFGPGKRFGNFGAIGVAWLFSEEDFMQRHLPVISFGKLRASIGSTGNDQLPDYQYLSTYLAGTYAYQGINGISPAQLTNPLYGWETIKKLEAALELGFFEDRLMFSASWYRNRTGNQLVGYPLPEITGFPLIRANLPAVIQNTGWEFDISSVNIKKEGFSWTSSVNLTIPRNKLVSYPGLEGSSYANTYVVGEPLFIAFLFTYKGVDPNTGLYTFEDYNKDGQISFSDDRRPVFTGQRFFGGLNNSLSWKGLSLDIFLQFVKQEGIRFLSFGPPGLMNANQPVGVEDRWQAPGDQSRFQRYTSQYADAYLAGDLFARSSGVAGNTSFVRLKNLALSWQLPDHWAKAAHLQQVRIYGQAQNLFTITNFEGPDPEVPLMAGGQFRLPPLRMITAGIQLVL